MRNPSRFSRPDCLALCLALRTRVPAASTAVSTSLDNSTDQLGAARAAYDNAKAAAGAAIGLLRLFHTKAWHALTAAGHVEVEGDLELAQVVNSSLYSILSSTREDFPYGLSPGSLANDGYNGHSFW